MNQPDTLSRVGRLRNTDHAFVSGGVFPCPRDIGEATRLTGREDEGQLLMEVWRQFTTNGIVGKNVLLGLNARMVSDHSDQDRIRIGERSVLRCMIRQEAQGRVNIGSYVYAGDNTIIHSTSEITIGDHTLIAHNVNILDNDTHPIDAEQRVAHFQQLLGLKPTKRFQIDRAPVKIGKRCWIGVNSVIMKGVEIGDETIVAAGSVVAKSLPAGVLAGGVPAESIKSL